MGGGRNGRMGTAKDAEQMLRVGHFIIESEGGEWDSSERSTLIRDTVCLSDGSGMSYKFVRAVVDGGGD